MACTALLAAAIAVGEPVVGAAADNREPAPTCSINVRSVCTGVTLLPPNNSADYRQQWATAIVEANANNLAVKTKLTMNEGLTVQSLRINTNPLEQFLQISGHPNGPSEWMADVDFLASIVANQSIDTMNFGPVQSISALVTIPYILRAGGYLGSPFDFEISCNISALHGAPDYEAALTLANQVIKIAEADPQLLFGFAATAGMPPGSPFSPGGYHVGGMGFSIGCETTNLVVAAFQGTGASRNMSRDSFLHKKSLMRSLFRQHLLPIQQAAKEVSAERGIEFLGLDASVTPGINSSEPLTAAYDGIGMGMFGQTGTLATSAMITDVLKTLNVGAQGEVDVLELVGYTGLMLPPLEDRGLANRSSFYTINDLLSYSAICGLGIDCTPIPGDTHPERLAALYCDVAMMSYRLSKPLTVRVIPIPGKRAGQKTNFSNKYLVDAEIMEIK